MILLYHLQEWSYSKQRDELQQKAPTLFSVVKTAANIEEVEKKGSQNKVAAKERGMLAGTAVLLQTRSKFCNAHGMMTGLQLKRGGASNTTFDRLSDRNLSVSYQTTLRKQKELGKKHDTELLQWANQVEVEDFREKVLKEQHEEIVSIAGEDSPEALKKLFDINEHMRGRHPGYKLVGDNADLRSHARQMSTKHRDHDHHFFNHVAIKNRVSGYDMTDANPYADVKNLPCSMFLPDVDDNNALREDWIFLIGHVIAKYIPALAWFDLHLPKLISHQYDDIASKKSEVVCGFFYFGVFRDRMLSICFEHFENICHACQT